MTLRYEPFDWYETPLYYDIIFDADTQKEADFLEALLQRHVPGKKGRILEPACGSGRIMAELGRRGHSVPDTTSASRWWPSRRRDLQRQN